MREKIRYASLIVPLLLAMLWAIPAAAEVYVQCPCINNNLVTGKPDPLRLRAVGSHPFTGATISVAAAWNPATQNIECKYTTGSGATLVTHDVACKFLTAGDGHITMADGADMFIFGFDEMTWDYQRNHGIQVDRMLNFATNAQCGTAKTCVNNSACDAGAGQACISGVCTPTTFTPCATNADCPASVIAPEECLLGGKRGQESSAPTINIKEGQEFYLSLTNVTMYERPDLFDPHTVHYHGFPNASSLFDGEPMASIAVPMGETLTYYYNNVEPGTYMYHCHVEAAEHMQMGMLGNLYVRPKQEGSAISYQGVPHTNFAYNDCPGTCSVTIAQICHTNADCPSPQTCVRPTASQASCGITGYDIAYPMEIIGMDPDFHHEDNSYNELDFANMDDRYALFNGRGYPDTINTCTDGRQTSYPTMPYLFPACSSPIFNSLGIQSQNTTSAVYAKKGQKILLRMPSLDTTGFRTVSLLGLPMQIVGQGARQYKGPTGLTYDYQADSVTLAGGEAYDIIIDTTNAAAGTYFLFTTNFNGLSNDAQDYGGLMTEIVINN